MGPGDLRRMLEGWTSASSVRVVLDAGHADDAGAVRLEGGRVLLHTVDVITPIVDDPETFGRVAAANAVSDIYAMAGIPTSAVAILGVPKELPEAALPPMFAGARAVLDACGAFLVGGHTLKDRELKLGFAVTGWADEDRLATHAGARAGEILVLTKPLGTGLLHQRACSEALSQDVEAAWWASMSIPNQRAGERLQELEVRAATDVTGYGLAGHALSLARGSRVDLWIDPGRLPRLPGVDGALAAGVGSGVGRANVEAVRGALDLDPEDDALLRLIGDPQTSGGLLFALPPEQLHRLQDLEHWVIGRVAPQREAEPMLRFERP